jgi:hypothetical protein
MPRFAPVTLPLAALIGALASLAGAAPALASSTTRSSNWAGYAVHRSGAHFKRVLGTWTQPSATCAPGTPTYSSVWVGLGGFSETSNALEQIGSEVDCSARGTVQSSAWYELVPAASRVIRMTVRPGDRLSAAVGVAGHEVTLTLRDLTRHRTFTRRVHVSVLDTTSADWILEAPSECSSAVSCQTLPLADFGTAAFSHAVTATTGGYVGSISDRHWDLTEITLAGGARRFIGQGGGSAAFASPSALAASGSAFTVTYRGASGQPTQTTAALARETPLVRPALAHR